jgi:hypothetical protein
LPQQALYLFPVELLGGIRLLEDEAHDG